MKTGRHRALLAACRRGFIGKVKRQLDSGAEVDCPDEDTFTPLMIACLNNFEAVATLLLDRGASIDMTNQSGSTALHLACANGHEACCRLLLERGASINRADCDGATALKEAAAEGSEACASLLLDHGASVDLADFAGVTPLMKASAQGHKQCVRLLTCHGASRSKTDHVGQCAAEVARLHHQLQTAMWLEATVQWTTPLHHLELLTPERTLSLLRGGASVHARAGSRAVAGTMAAASGSDDPEPSSEAPSPISLARALERAGKAPSGSAAALMLGWWRARLLALAMGTHARLGEGSAVLKLGGVPEVLQMIVLAWMRQEACEEPPPRPAEETPLWIDLWRRRLVLDTAGESHATLKDEDGDARQGDERSYQC